MLYVVPTPIGNLKDITLRAIEVLQRVEYILAEDTRVTAKLLHHYQIEKPLKSYHNFNEHRIADNIIADLSQDQDIALVSDAGTPGISDPGYLLISKCIEADIAIEVLPGANAIIPAVVLSGLPNNRFHFEGFLPHKKGRHTRLEALKTYGDMIVLYESPHRIHKTIKELLLALGDRPAVLTREISKKFEESIRGTLSTISSEIEGKTVKGEIVLIVGRRQSK